jgi:DNA end-binding protein Ku
MPPRSMWKGQLRLSLVSFGVRLYAATESAGRVTMNQLHADCHQRLKNQLSCPVHGPVGRDEVVKGYEYEKDTYVIIEPDDIEAIRLKSTKVIDLEQFVDAGEIDDMLIDSPYFLGPDGPVAEEPFRVIREAMRETGTVGIGKVVMHSRERVVSIQPQGRGFLLTTLRYANEVRKPDQYFTDVKDDAVNDEQLALARNIIESRRGSFDASAFSDSYRDAFFDMIKTKVAGQKPVIVEDEQTPTAYNFMDALRESVAQAGSSAAKPKSKAATKKKTTKKAKKPAAKSVTKKKTVSKKKKRA